MQMRPPHDVATYAPDSLEVHYNNKRYALKNAIPEGKKPTAELVSSGNLIVRYNMSSRLKCVQECEEMITNENTKSINNKRHKHIPSPASPPSLGLPPPSLLQKSWEFVRDAEEYEAKRKLAPLTGSVLEAQLLISRVEVFFWLVIACNEITKSQ